MSTFNFKLQPVLNYKKQFEASKKNDFGKAVMELETEKDRLSGMEEVKDKYINHMENGANGAIDINKMKEYNSFLFHMRKEISNQSENIAGVQISVDKKREILVQAMKEKQTLDKLREKHLTRFNIEENRKDQLITDEIASYKHKIKSTGV